MGEGMLMKTSSGNGSYVTTLNNCTCPGFRYRGTCKHVNGVKFAAEGQEIINSLRLPEIEEIGEQAFKGLLNLRRFILVKDFYDLRRWFCPLPLTASILEMAGNRVVDLVWYHGEDYRGISLVDRIKKAFLECAQLKENCGGRFMEYECDPIIKLNIYKWGHGKVILRDCLSCYGDKRSILKEKK